MEGFEPVTQNLPPLNVVLDLIYYILLGFFAIFTGVIYYHWTTYATDKALSRITLVAYMVFTLPLLLIMGGIILTI